MFIESIYLLIYVEYYNTLSFPLFMYLVFFFNHISLATKIVILV